jgi:hypothetical protein
MPVAVKPLFRPETLARKLGPYQPPPAGAAAPRTTDRSRELAALRK